MDTQEEDSSFYNPINPRGIYDIPRLAIYTYFCSLGSGVAEIEKHAEVTSLQRVFKQFILAVGM